MLLMERAALVGTVERVTFYNPASGFSVIKLKVRGRRTPVAVVGTLPAVQPGETLALEGRWRTDPRHGAQFEPSHAETRRPTDLDGIVRYLGSGLIYQIGPVLAARIVDHFGQRTLDVLDATPQRVREVPGIGSLRARTIAAAWVEHRALRAVAAFLAEHGLDTRLGPRLVRAYGADAPTVLGTDPYRPVGQVAGFGFGAADRLGVHLGIAETAPARLRAAVRAVLVRAAEEGHTRLERAALVAAAARLAEVDAELVAGAVGELVASGAVVGVGSPSPNSLGLAGLARAEAELAGRILNLISRPVEDARRAEAWLAADADARALSREQRVAVRTAAASGCFVLTGGPGVGKTTATRALARCLMALGRSVALAAPTGKAAKRLGEVVGLEAKTLHRLLGVGPRGFRHGPRQPLPFDTVIVDEASMLDTLLARALARAIRPGGQLILVGDADQLPSVGPGQVLRDLLASERVPAARLERVFRQAERSRIVTNAHRVRRGLAPELAPAATLAEGVDCVFVPAAAGQVAALGAEWAARRLPLALGVGPDEVQALAPLTRVCQALNSTLQGRLNPPRGQPERPHGALPLRRGDRVIQTRNNYHLGVFNGDSGTLLGIDGETLAVDFGDGRIVEYGPADAPDLDHAYCLTVHRAQGSEWPGVVVLISSSYGQILTRNLLYTALTRARRAVVLVGDRAAIERAVADTRAGERTTGLAQLLAGVGTASP